MALVWGAGLVQQASNIFWARVLLHQLHDTCDITTSYGQYYLVLLSIILRWLVLHSTAYRARSHFSIARAQATLADIF